MDEGYEKLKTYAAHYSLDILMSNYTGTLWNMKSGGKSAFWNSSGDLMGHLGGNESGILIAEKCKEKWTIKKRIII